MLSKVYLIWGLSVLFSAFESCTPSATEGSFVTSTTEAATAAGNETNSISSQSVPKIYEMRVDSNVSSRFVRTLITSKVRNLDSKAQEATFSVVTPERAFITGFVMEIGGKKYEAYIEEKVQAKKTYDEAVLRGQSAAHVAASARDSNRFTVSVNLEPETKAIFYLTYEEFLLRKNEQYEVVLNIHPGQPVQNLTVEVRIAESRPLTFVRTPSLRSGNEIAKNDTDSKPEADIQRVNETSAVVTFSPDVAKQKLLTVGLGGKEDEGLSGQFVVQYDVERDPQGGEVLVDGGYFVHFFAPEDLPPLKKQVIFVLDTSGSMWGTKINQLKQAMDSILSELKPEDTFSIVTFSSGVSVWNIPEETVTYEDIDDRYFHLDSDPKPEDKEAKVLPGSVPATEENVRKARNITQQLEATAATNIYGALEVALKITSITKDPKTNQPIIVFLTDGEPNVGISSPEAITSKITELNVKKTPIFSLSFGEGADKEFLSKLSLKNQGFSRHIYEAADAHLQLEDFYKQISSPLLSNVTFKYVDNVKNVTRNHFPILFSGGELYIAGKIDDPNFAPPEVEGWGVRGPILLKPKVYQAADKLERLWAYLTVKQLLEQREIAEDKTGPTQEALRLALKYSFVTDVSSLVVVKPNSTTAVDTVDAAQSEVVRPVYRLQSGYNHNSFVGVNPNPPRLYLTSISLAPAMGFADRHATRDHLYTYSSAMMVPEYESYSQSPSPFDQLRWLASALNPNGTLSVDNVAYSLGENEHVTGEYPCSNSVNGTKGSCSLLSDCPQIFATLVDLAAYKEHFCVVQSFAGVCCPIAIP